MIDPSKLKLEARNYVRERIRTKALEFLDGIDEMRDVLPQEEFAKKTMTASVEDVGFFVYRPMDRESRSQTHLTDSSF
jgi:hypothetical protein